MRRIRHAWGGSSMHCISTIGYCLRRPFAGPGLVWPSRCGRTTKVCSCPELNTSLARNYGPQPPGISRLLRDIEVRSVDEVHVEWVVRSPSQKTIEHYADRRLALIVKNNNRAQLYIRHRDADARNLQFELSEQLSQLCGVPLEHTSLLWAALLLKNIELLDNALDRGGILRAINCSNVNVEVDRPSSRSNSSTRESEITEVTRSIVSRDYKSLVSEKSDNAVTLSRTESDVPYMSRGETRVAMNYNKESFIRQWQQISARAQLHSDDNNPLSSISMHGAPWRERTTAKSTGASELSSVPRSPASETYGRRRNVPSGRISGDQISDIGSWELDHQDGRSIAQVTDSHYPNRAPKSSTTPHMIFCSTMKELPEMDVDGRNISGQATLPARLQVLDNGVQTVFIARNITTLIDHEPAFLGEVFVCEFLRHVLGSAYNPEKHWTSPLRSRCGHAPLPAPDNAPLSSFYIDASTGRAMTEFLKTKSIKHAEYWDFSPPDYHIDVQTTVDDISASFTWSVLNFDMARRWRVRGSSQHQGCIYILIRVSNIYEDPKVRMFVDPWDMIEEGELLIKSSSNLVANIHNGAHSGIELIDFQNKKPPQPDSFVSQISLYTTLAISGQRSTVNSNVYVWKPLKEPARHIRLLHLLPGKGIEDLRGDLIISAITDRVEYDAISYTWGSALQPFTLHTTEGNIPITTSLYVALMRMRKHKEAIWLWVDAICINQKDDIEKAAQISMMPDIFRSATRVYAWIGEEGDGSSEVIETLKQIAKQRLEPTMPSSNRYQDIPPLGRIFWNNLGKLLERKWFRRIWIVQEIVLARDIMVLCGKESVPWSQFCDMIRLCFDYAKQCSSGLVLSRGSSTGSVLRLAKFRRECRENGEFEARYPLLSLFEHFQLTEATRRRDKLFALLNLASDNCEELGPDYKAPLEDIIWRYACTFVKNGHVMELLYRSGRSSDPRFPSWVPDWTSAPYPRTLSKWKCKTKPHRFTAATRFLVYGQLGFEKVLSLRGHLVDNVSRVGVCPSYTSVFPAYLLETSTMVDECLPNLTRAEAAIVKWRLPIGDSDMVPEEERTLCQESIHDSHHAEPNIAGFPGVTQEYIAIASEFADFFSPAVACCTVMGKLGIVPAKTRVGDKIAVFRSGRVPFILREKEMLRDHYEVIGECYIDGMMHGEYIEQSAQYQDINLV
ncbi:heterokaryon incompatibility protein-domain-containing protein [Aspergillus parasiticus]|uniref:Heterokaryon incompatibility protein-domain-containing protein n=1 Tax=Aspergillus parasiticus TaxID=5067 RepID=A0A5N6DS91_ASPPA|nr:heterokaryon incompatibility protein-domain-containing protein [Aspergillus parasiticus]